MGSHDPGTTTTVPIDIMAEFNLEQQRALAIASARLRLQDEEAATSGNTLQDESSGIGDFLSAHAKAAGRGLGLSGRAGLSGVGLGGLANIVGLPQPESSTERVVQDVASTIAGGGVVGAGAKTLARGAQGITQPILNMIAANPGAQAVASAGAGTGAGLARENDVGPIGQFFSSLAGGTLAPSATGAAKYFGGKATDIGATMGAAFGSRRGVDRLTADAVTTAAGDSKQKVLAALMNRPSEYVQGVRPTVAEAIAEAQMGRPEQFGGGVVRLQKDLTGAQGIEDILPNVFAQQRAAMIDPIYRMAGGSTNAAQNRAQEVAAALRNQITAPMREVALTNANIAGVKVPQLERRIASRAGGSEAAVEDVRRLSRAGQSAQELAHGGTPRLGPPRVQEFPGMPRVPERYGYGEELAGIADRTASEAAAKSLQRGAERRFLEMQLGSLESHGLRPLDGSKVVNHIDRILDRPGEGIVTLNQKVLGAIRDKIAEAVAKRGGRLDAEDLYAIRKTEINDVVASLTKDADASTKNRAASLATSIKSRIDDAIETAGGTGWKDYLKKYAELSTEIDRMKVAQALSERLLNSKGNETAATFLTGIGRGEESMLRRSSGAPRDTTIETLFPAQDAAHIRGVESQLARQAEADRIAASVRGTNISNLTAAEVPHP